jgi:hypothetical protein
MATPCWTILSGGLFFQVLALNTVGRMVERSFADWLEALFISSWPDSRI